MQYFKNQGADLYFLHDCDLHGYFIYNTVKNGSKTFKDSVDI